MPSESAIATNWSRYAEQAMADLEEIHRRQRDLTSQLESLQREESLLKGILDLAEHPTAAPGTPPVATPFQRGPGAGPGPHATAPGALSPAADSAPVMPREDAGDARKGGDHVRPRSGKSSAKRKGRRQALLGELLFELLRAHGEPRLASELREELLRTHPDRSPTPQVVRNTLEALVAKGLVERHKHDRSVLYTPAETGHHSGETLPDDDGAQHVDS